VRTCSGIIQHEVGQLASVTFGKAFLIGEYDWTTTQSALPLSDYLSYIESQKPNIGECVFPPPLRALFLFLSILPVLTARTSLRSMIWNVMGHDPQCCRYVSHNDGASPVDLLKREHLARLALERARASAVPY